MQRSGWCVTWETMRHIPESPVDRSNSFRSLARLNILWLLRHACVWPLFRLVLMILISPNIGPFRFLHQKGVHLYCSARVRFRPVAFWCMLSPFSLSLPPKKFWSIGWSLITTGNSLDLHYGAHAGHLSQLPVLFKERAQMLCHHVKILKSMKPLTSTWSSSQVLWLYSFLVSMCVQFLFSKPSRSETFPWKTSRAANLFIFSCFTLIWSAKLLHVH